MPGGRAGWRMDGAALYTSRIQYARISTSNPTMVARNKLCFRVKRISCDCWRIQSADKHLFVKTAASHSGHESDGGSELVFNRYGDQYFLRRILCPSVSR